MALESQIESAVRAGKRPSMLGKERFTGAEILTHVGRGTPSVEAAELARAARNAYRMDEDVAQALGLQRPADPRTVVAQLGADALEGLLAAVGAGEQEARRYVAGLLRIEAEAARAVLAERRAGDA